jgi:hypothetical protein
MKSIGLLVTKHALLIQIVLVIALVIAIAIAGGAPNAYDP